MHTLIPIILMSSMSVSGSPDSVVVENHSFASPDVIVKHLDINLAVDFANKRLTGNVGLYIENTTGSNRLILDTRDLMITKVTTGDKRRPTSFALGDSVPHLGRPLIIDIEPDTKLVTVDYETLPGGAALQFLDPAQTAGGVSPFLFTQSEAILARTWIPCQDNPAHRITYRAKISVPKGMLALMSAQNDPKISPTGTYEFYMPQPIPTYLLALAVGDIAFRPISDRCGVYAEPGVIGKAAWEFADTEKMVKAAEKLYGPYRWGRYDILVLPPSFPFGGMENPQLTFATPTVIAGDRSLVALVAHELAHSWSGNLVTNATWNDFWLNEGFTVYFERRIVEELYGKDYAETQAVLGLQDLQDEINELGAKSPDTHLLLNLAGRDPDDGATDVPYEKGYFFLRLIEETVGRPKWDAFLRGYFDTFAFRTMTTKRFLGYMNSELLHDNKALAIKLNIDAWINGPGIPANCPTVSSRELDISRKAAGQCSTGKPLPAGTGSGWTTQQWVYFIRNLAPSLNPAQMGELDSTFSLTNSGNSEILFEWLLRAVKSGYAAAYPAMEKFLTSVGRRKFLKPLYTELAKTGDGLALAKEIYAKARPGYHAVAVRTVDDILHWQ